MKAEAFLSAGFPTLDIKQLEVKAGCGGVGLAELELLLLPHLVPSPRAQPALAQLGGTAQPARGPVEALKRSFKGRSGAVSPAAGALSHCA